MSVGPSCCDEALKRATERLKELVPDVGDEATFDQTLDVVSERFLSAQQSFRKEKKGRLSASRLRNDLEIQLRSLQAGSKDLNSAMVAATERMDLSVDDSFGEKPLAIFDLNPGHSLFSLGETVNALIRRVNLIHFTFDKSTSIYESRVTPRAQFSLEKIDFARRLHFASASNEGD